MRIYDNNIFIVKLNGSTDSEYSYLEGNDLIIRRKYLANWTSGGWYVFGAENSSTPEWPYVPGLKNGDKWCVCASFYAGALEAGKACPVYLKGTHQKTLELIPIEKLKKFAVDLS